MRGRASGFGTRWKPAAAAREGTRIPVPAPDGKGIGDRQRECRIWTDRREPREQAGVMGSIQLAMSDAGRAEALRGLLARSTHVPVHCVECPDFEAACVVVMDAERFGTMTRPLIHPERIVLITRNDAGHLKEAWEAGVNSVLSEQDPMNTVVLAVLAACLRTGTLRPKSAGGRIEH